LTKNPEFVQALIDAPEKVALEPRPRALVNYAIQLTQAPASMRREDLEPLRHVGLTERGILDLNMIVGYFAFVNRLADGLGVPLEEYWQSEPDP
jgi:uncharacterized peroxidase-related enzyme